MPSVLSSLYGNRKLRGWSCCALRESWLCFCACAGCELIAGQVYGFGLFSDLLRDERGLALTQASVESVAVAENLGQYGRLVGGFVYDRCGARFTVRAGLVLNSLGYLAIYAAARLASAGDSAASSEDGWKCPASLLCVFGAMYGQGAGWIELSVISTAVTNFPAEASGLLKTFFGMASAVGAVAFAALFAPSKLALLLALGLCPLVLGLPLSGFVHMQNSDPKSGLVEPWKGAYVVAFAMAAMLTAHSTIASTTTLLRPYEDHPTANILFFGFVLGLLATLPFLPAVRLHTPTTDAWQEGRRAHSVIGKDLSFLEALRHQNLWLLLFALAAGEGAGLMVLNNMGQLVRALDNGATGLQPVCVSAFSVSNATGRLCMGHLAATGPWSRRMLLMVTLVMTAIAYAIFANLEGKLALLAAMPCLGFAYGCLWSLQPLLTSELLGKRSYGSKYALISLAAFLGGMPLCRFAVPFFYNAHVDDNGWCVGGGCFRGSILAASLQCLVGATLAFCLNDVARKA